MSGVTNDNDVEANKKIIIKNVELWNSGDADGLRGQFHPEYVAYMNEDTAIDGEGYVSRAEMYWKAFPDIDVTIHNLYGEGNVISKHWSMKGTLLGDSLGIAPTGKVFELKNGLSIYKFENGLIREYHVVHDSHTFMQQLGLLPENA